MRKLKEKLNKLIAMSLATAMLVTAIDTSAFADELKEDFVSTPFLLHYFRKKGIIKTEYMYFSKECELEKRGR